MLDNLKSFYLNSKGFKSSRRIVVIESDDWGSVRMPSKQAYVKLKDAGINVEKCGYNRYDSLETVEDLEIMYENFQKIKDKNGNNPILTANTIVANPDFEKIRKDNFEKYHFEPFDKSYLRHQGNHNTLAMIDNGINAKMYFPQLHGREHIYVDNWMKALKNGDSDTRIAFDNEVYGLSTTMSLTKRKSFLTALDGDDLNGLEKHQLVLAEAQKIFEGHFGYSSKSFIAANYTWHQKHETFLSEIGIDTIQGGRAQKVPGNSDNYETVKHYMGKINSLGQLYLIRNASFEPSTRKNINWRQKVLGDVKIAFMVGAPVIISTHRVNFMGGIVRQNREDNIKEFCEILAELVAIYPNIEFMNTVELSNYIRSSKND